MSIQNLFEKRDFIKNYIDKAPPKCELLAPADSDISKISFLMQRANFLTDHFLIKVTPVIKNPPNKCLEPFENV